MAKRNRSANGVALSKKSKVKPKDYDVPEEKPNSMVSAVTAAIAVARFLIELWDRPGVRSLLISILAWIGIPGAEHLNK